MDIVRNREVREQMDVPLHHPLQRCGVMMRNDLQLVPRSA
jgi:hypothetical protein